MTMQELADFITEHIKLNPGGADQTIYAQNGGEIHGLGFGGTNTPCLTHEYYPKHDEESKWEYFEAMFEKAKIPVKQHWELTNQYWPRCYTKDILEQPWWLVSTPWGLIQIGWRKRVINIQWENTNVRAIITKDDVTKDKTYVHAWSEDKAVEYLKAWHKKLILGPDTNWDELVKAD